MRLVRRFLGEGAGLVGLGIFLSRIVGLIREKIFAYYFGDSAVADVFRAALRIPNFLQNLLGEGVLSGSFIPVYARLLAEGKSEEARKIAGQVLSLLCALTGIVAAAGVLLSPLLIDLIAPGFEGERRELCILLVRILFPGLGLLVLSAFCLGVLNSHKKFFLSYVAPVLWNLSIILAMVFWSHQSSQEQLIVYTTYGVVAGCFFQLLVQLPLVFRLLKGFEWCFSRRQLEHSLPLKRVLSNFFPIVTGRGVVQISAYLDTVIASFLPIGSLAYIGYAQTLYLLPISLFGMSVSAVELPLMSQTLGATEEIKKKLQNRVRAANQKISFFIVPTFVGFIVLGPSLLRILYQGGAFTEQTTQNVWFVLIAMTLGLIATTQSRVFSSTFYVLQDAKTPLRFALIRVLVSVLLGFILGMFVPRHFALPSLAGVVGLALAGALASGLEWWLLKQKLAQNLGSLSLSKKYLLKLWTSALLALGPSLLLMIRFSSIFDGLKGSFLVLVLYGISFFVFAFLLRLEELSFLMRKNK